MISRAVHRVVGSAGFWSREIPRRTKVACFNALLRRPKAVSAMVRIRNEEQFLYPSIKSIVEHVEEVVLIDHLSTDATPRIIRQLKEEHPDKVVAVRYPHEVHTYGEAHKINRKRLFASRSPHMLGTFFNWCLRQCSQSYVIKWDADMIAIGRFYAALDEWRRSPDRDVLMFPGVNLHPDLRHLLAPIDGGGDRLMQWTALSYVRPDAMAEPRLFPRALAHYDNGFEYCERLLTPFERTEHMIQIKDPCYLHMKYCKTDPYNNMSSDLERAISSSVRPGEPVTAEVAAAIRAWGLDRAGERPRAQSGAAASSQASPEVSSFA